MIINWHNASHHSSYGNFRQLPTLSLGIKPEIAFSGRSNVGKSSCINKLLNRKSLVRVSSRPGKTITINYFNIDEKIYIVDLPGYGYAKIAKSEKERFGLLTEMYLQSDRVALLVQLIDFRHPPTNDDLMMLEFLREKQINHVIVLTKADKLRKMQREKMRAEFSVGHAALGVPTIIEYSAETGEGVEELRQVIENHGN
jgi:GTP-binding protein